MYNHQLDTFIVVADSGSFNKAAEALFISPPAVIKQINLLEDSLGVRLFTLTHRGLQLTKAGQSVYEDARYIIAYCRESVERAKKADDTHTSVLRIGTSTMTPGQTVVDMWTQIREEIPDIKFQLVPFENKPENAREILKNEVIATAIMRRLDIPHIDYELLWDENAPYCVCDDFVTPETDLVSAWQVMMTVKQPTMVCPTKRLIM